MPLVNIGVIAGQAHVATSTIRYYGRIGLLPPPRRVSGKRQYDSSVLKQLRVIQSAQQAGLTLTEIRLLLHGFPANTPPAVRWQTLAGEKLVELEQQMIHLQAMKAMLEQTLHCQCATLEECAGEKDQAAGAGQIASGCADVRSSSSIAA
jgi:MerR family transcriptional regulator, redox-sensitive transcriptional activator SoxR